MRASRAVLTRRNLPCGWRDGGGSRNWHAERPFLFRVGIARCGAKSIAYRLLAPALTLPEQVRMVCREDKLERLLRSWRCTGSTWWWPTARCRRAWT